MRHHRHAKTSIVDVRVDRRVHSHMSCDARSREHNHVPVISNGLGVRRSRRVAPTGTDTHA